MRSPRYTIIRRPRSANAGFTLLETSLAIVIIGTGVLAIMAAHSAFHQQNEWSTHAATATFLANEIREMTRRLPRHDPVYGTTYWGPEPNELTLADFNDLDDFAGTQGLGTLFSAADNTGPINAMRQVIPNMPGWSQEIQVFNVLEDNISAPGDPSLNGQTSVIRMTVIVRYQGPRDIEPEEVTRLTWISER